jgi:ParB family chromosome partitioning protein
VSKTRVGGLGRGLGALIPTAPAGPPGPGRSGGTDGASATQPTGATRAAEPASGPITPGDVRSDEGGPLPVPGVSYIEVDVNTITTNPRQPRQVFDEESLAELAHSIREFGVLQPVVVRRSSAGYELVMGERRLRAAVAAGLETIPTIVRDTDDDAMLRDALLENIHRAALNPLEEAAAYQQLLNEFSTTHDELAQRIGRSRPQISNTIRLLNLPVPVQRRVAAGVLSAGHARALLGLESAETQEDLASRIVAEGLSVRSTEELVSVYAHGYAQQKTTRKPAAPRIVAPAVADLADKLSDTLDTRVRVDLGRRKGKITVEFASVDDLERIVALIAPQVASSRGQSARANEP